VAILDLATGLSIRSLAGHSNPVEDVAFAADGGRLASSGGDGTTVIWDVESGRKLHVLRGDGGVTRVRFSPDDRLIATAGKDSTVRLWDAGTGRELRALKGHTGMVYGLGFNPGGRRLATCGMDRSVKLWDVATGQELLTLRGTHNQTTGVSFHPDGRRLAAIDTSQNVVIWDASPWSPEEQGRRRDQIVQQRGSRYLRAATQAMVGREWTGALWFLDRMPTESGPARARALAGRGEVLGQLGRYAESARAFEQLCALPGTAGRTWGRWALVSYGAGDLAGCRAAVITLLDRFGTDPGPQLANEVAWASVRFPDCIAEGNRDRALRLAQGAVDQSRATGSPRMSRGQEANLLNTLGAAHYRAGDAASAAARLDEAIRVRDRSGMWADWLFLAMAHHRLGHIQEARDFFDRAMRWWTEEHRGGADCLNWSEHLEFQLIRREAEALLRDPSTELPADVFAP
jgi:tetratricopeptide (TPR) repeat protein